MRIYSLLIFMLCGLANLSFSKDDTGSKLSLYEEKGKYFFGRSEMDSSFYYFNKITQDDSPIKDYAKIGKAYSYLATISVNRNDEEHVEYYRRSIENYQSAISVLTNKSEYDNVFLLRTYLNVGMAYSYIDNIDSSYHYFEKIVNHVPKIEDEPALYGKVNLFLGRLSSAKENFIVSEEYYKNAIFHFEKAGRSKMVLADFYSEYATVCQQMGNDNKALEYITKSLNCIRGEQNKVPNLLAQAHLLNNRGIILESLGRLNAAERDYLSVLKVYENEVSGNYLGKISAILNNLSNVYENKLQFSKAIQTLQKSVDINIKRSNHNDLAINYENIANNYLKLGNYDLALKYIQLSLKFHLHNYNEEGIYINPDPNEVLESDRNYYLTQLIQKSKILVAKYHQLPNQVNFDDINNIFFDIELLIKAIRKTQFSEYSKNRLSAQTKAYLIQKLRFIISSKTTIDDEFLSDIFRSAETLKSLALLESLKENNAMQNSGIPEEIINQEKQIGSTIIQIEKQLKEVSVTNVGANLAVELRDKHLLKLRDREDLILKIEKDYPDYYQKKYNINITSIPQVQHNLTGNQTLISYFVGKETLYAFVIEKEKAELISIPKDFPLSAYIQMMRGGIFNTFYDDKYDKIEMNAQYAEYGYLLYRKLIEPLGNLKEEVIIIPDGELGFIPFDALLQKAPSDPNRFSTHEYFGKNYQISNNYSATLWLEMRAKTVSKEGFLGVAPEFPLNPAMANALSSIRGKEDNLWRLNFNESEVEGIYELFGGRKLLSEDASMEEFKKWASKYSILHLATHALIDNDNIEFSYLAFTKMADSLENKMFIKDLYELELNAQMVVLSACETGIGELKEGEGIYSLARGFAHTGVKSIINSLWSIDDAPSSQLMVNFYQKLSDGLPKDKALQLAKKEYYLNTEEEWQAHPFYWAAFVPIGDMSPVELASKFNYLNFSDTLLGVIGMTLLLMFYSVRRRKEAQKLIVTA